MGTNMFYALDKQEKKIAPTSGLTAICPCCRTEVIAKTGNIKQHHWAHKSLADCDGWYEMTAWHLQWQQLFALECREVVMQKGDIKHRADVKIGNLIIEFQHSTLSSWQVEERELFYGSDVNKLIWIIDGTGNRVWDGWKEQLSSETAKPVFITDKDSKIYFELVGYCGISIARQLSLPIGLVVNPKYPTFVDLGEYIACPLETSAYTINRIGYSQKWGHKSALSVLAQCFVLVHKDSFIKSLYHLPTNLSSFQSIKLCDEETIAKRGERIEIAKRNEEEARNQMKKREELKKRKEEARAKKYEQFAKYKENRPSNKAIEPPF
jgi:hypothetical protein